MKYITYNGKSYRVYACGMVDVRVSPSQTVRVMRDPRKAYWRKVKTTGKLADAIRKAAADNQF